MPPNFWTFTLFFVCRICLVCIILLLWKYIHRINSWKLSQRADVLLIFVDNSKLLSKKIITVYTPTSNVWESMLIHNLWIIHKVLIVILIFTMLKGKKWYLVALIYYCLILSKIVHLYIYLGVIYPSLWWAIYTFCSICQWLSVWRFKNIKKLALCLWNGLKYFVL